MYIDSPAFAHEQQIPIKYTCMGQDVSPPLAFHEIPENTKSLILIVEDPDAPTGNFVHWIVWNIPANVKQLPEGAPISNQGTNGFKEVKYKGPCPPPGKPHRYFFRLYALDTTLSLNEGATKQVVEKAMKNHIIAKSELMGTFQR